MPVASGWGEGKELFPCPRRAATRSPDLAGVASLSLGAGTGLLTPPEQAALCLKIRATPHLAHDSRTGGDRRWARVGGGGWGRAPAAQRSWNPLRTPNGPDAPSNTRSRHFHFPRVGAGKGAPHSPFLWARRLEVSSVPRPAVPGCGARGRGEAGWQDAGPR